MVFFGDEQVSKREVQGADSGWCGTAQVLDGLVVGRGGVRQALLGAGIGCPAKRQGVRSEQRCEEREGGSENCGRRPGQMKSCEMGKLRPEALKRGQLSLSRGRDQNEGEKV